MCSSDLNLCHVFWFSVTQFILDQQDLKLKKNSKSRKKRKQNTDEEEGVLFLQMFFVCRPQDRMAGSFVCVPFESGLQCCLCCRVVI